MKGAADVMTDQEFEAALKSFPCPECSEAGRLATKHLVLRIAHRGTVVEVGGQGWVCEGGCNVKFMSDTMAEELANKIAKIDDSACRQYYEVDRQTGELLEHGIH